MHTTDDIERRETVRATQEHDIPKIEPWLVVLMASFVPTIMLIFLPDSFRFPLYLVIGVTLLVSVVMLVRREIERGRR
jgi:hypothetical protein